MPVYQCLDYYLTFFFNVQLFSVWSHILTCDLNESKAVKTKEFHVQYVNFAGHMVSFRTLIILI